LAEELFRPDGRTDRLNDANSLFSHFFLDFNEIRIFYKDFRKLTIQISISCLVRKFREGGADIMNRILQFRYAITNALHIYRSPAKFLAFLQTLEPISHYCLSGQHSYTRGLLTDNNALISDNPILYTMLKINHSEFHCGIVLLHFLLRHYFFPDPSNS